METKKTKTLNRFFLDIFGKDNQNMIVIITPELLEDFESVTKDFLKGQAKAMISRKLYHDLRNNEGDRLKIIEKSMKETAFDYHFTLIKDFRSRQCKEPKDHLYYYLYTDRDMYESESYYGCIYCGTQEEDSARGQLMGKVVRSTFMPQKKLQLGKGLLMKLISTNPSKEEIKALADVIVELAL